MNYLYYGDNLKVLKSLYHEKRSFLDLIYIDPPFNSKRNYNILFEDLIQSAENGKKTTALKEAFSDTWSNVSLSSELEEMKGLDNLDIYNFLTNNRNIFSDSQMSYLTMMAHRLYYMHRLLKNTGSLYLHCDPTMSHYLKVLMDIIFGVKNFRNEIVWCYNVGGKSKKTWAKKHDIIFFYTKTNKYNFNGKAIGIPRDTGSKSKGGKMGKDKNGRPYHDKLVKATGKYYRYYLDEPKIPEDWWVDINSIQSGAKERLGYPTQKPLILLERIIKASSNEGDTVADFFCGCGTSITAAEKLKRNWIGVDINHLAIGLVESKRLNPLKAKYQAIGFPTDLAQAEKLAKDAPFEFERWIVEYIFKGHCTSKTGDGGFDGHIAFEDGQSKKLCLIEVKGGTCNIAALRAFNDTIKAKKADIGLFICFEKRATSGMKKYCDSKGFEGLFSIPKLSIITIEDILNKNLPAWIVQFLSNVTYT